MRIAINKILRIADIRSMNERFHGCFNQLTKQQSCFAVFRQPRESITWIASKSLPEAKPHFDATKGFWMAPFTSTALHPYYVIPPDFFTVGEGGFDFPESIPGFERNVELMPPAEMHQSMYGTLLTEGINHLQQGNLDKFIFSRCSHESSAKAISEIFGQLCSAYSNALVFYVQHPAFGSWIGATPETLLQGASEYGKTQSLAGTQPVNSNQPWGQKELDEQAFVTKYIADNLALANISFEQLGPNTYKAGPVQHLLTVFQTPAFQTDEQVVEIINRLHPTPAVCGIPKEQAQEFIIKLEPEARAYYTGFLGFYQQPDNFHFFVNLRSMQVFENLLVLRLGGGITAQSSVKAEWDETELKAQTLLQVIQ